MIDKVIAQLREVGELLQMADDTAALLSMIDFIPAAQRKAIKNLRKMVVLSRKKTVSTIGELAGAPAQQWAGLSKADCADIASVLTDWRDGKLSDKAEAIEHLCVAGCDVPLAMFLIELTPRDKGVNGG